MGFLDVIPEKAIRERGCFEFPDLTPKPLKIAKRGQARTSNPVNISKLPSLPELSVSPSSGPIEAISIPPIRKGLDPSQENVVAPSFSRLPWNWVTDLNNRRSSKMVHTRRLARNSALGMTIGSRSLHSSEGPCIQPASIFVDSDFGKTTDKICDNAAAEPTRNRAVSVSAIHDIDAWNATSDKKPSASENPPSISTKHRVLTGNEASYRISDPEMRVPGNSISRKSSTKYKLIRRVMSGIIHRNKPFHPPSNASNNAMQSPNNESVLYDSSDADNGDGIPWSASSVKTNGFGVSDFRNVISAFPTPPKAATSSRTASGSSGSSCPSSQQCRGIHRPEDGSTLGAQLVLTPEHEQSDTDGEKAMFVAIDIAGTLNQVKLVHESCSKHTGLSVVAVIDNSLFTSPSTLMASCETTRFLASILNATTDRLAVVCTSIYSAHGSASTTVWPLTPIKMHKLKQVLDGITCSTEQPTPDMWLYTIDRARELLSQSGMVDRGTNYGSKTFGHVFLLTAHTDCVSPEILTHERLHVHMVCPAIVPHTDRQAPTLNGWKLGSMSAQEPRAVTIAKDTDPLSLFNKIRSLISQARNGKLPGNLTDLVLHIEPGMDCSIEGVVGNTDWPALHPGELQTVIIKLRARPSKLQGYSLSPKMHQSEISGSHSDFMNEIDRMLGVVPVRVLTATLQYKHSLLPAGTTCSITAGCFLKKGVASLELRHGQLKSESAEPTACAVLVQRRLAYHIATHGSPGQALLNIRKEFGETGSHSSCPDYISLVIKELKYQARIIERIEIEKSPKKPSSPDRKDKPDSPSEYFGQGLFDFENFKPDTWINETTKTGSPPDEEIQLAGINGRKENQKTFQTSKWLYSEPDEKAAILADMKKASRRQKELDMRRSPKTKYMAKGDHGRRALSSNLELERQMRVRELAARDQEAKGIGSLRAITSFGESMAKGLGGL